VWTRGKLAEPINSKFIVLGGAIPPTTTNLKRRMDESEIEEAIDLESTVLGGASPPSATNFYVKLKVSVGHFK